MDLPDLSEIPHLGLGTAALLIFAAVVVLILLRGTIRVFWATAVLCASGYLAFLVWDRAPAHLRDTPDWMPAVLAVAAFVISFALLRFAGRFLVDPFGKGESVRGRSLGGWLAGLGLGLIPAGLLIFGAGLLLHHFGTLAELESYSRQIREREIPAPLRWLEDLKHDLGDLLPEDWFAFLDPATEKTRVTLAKVISNVEDAPPKAVPVLEEFQIREIIRQDPELRRLAAEGRYREILHDPKLDRMLENEDLREVLAGLSL